MRGIKHKNPMQTRHGRTRYKAFTIKQLIGMYDKSSTPKVKDKIRNELNRKLTNAGLHIRVQGS